MKINTKRTRKENLNMLPDYAAGFNFHIRTFSEDIFNPKLVPSYVTNISVFYNDEDNKKYFQYRDDYGRNKSNKKHSEQLTVDELINDDYTSSANCKRIIDDILMPNFWKQASAEFLQIIFLSIIHTDTQHRTFADVIKLLSTATFDKNGYMDKDCDLAKLLINFRNLYSQGSKEYEQCKAILNIPKATFKPIKQIMIDKLSPYKDEVVE